ncbi:hypothetical protein C0W54_16730 [Photobacterium kishitanii]|uniref:hypothetical protein n=1 Tax=Photobacterium kishitanii TaxID=318456 RepID=UPI000D16257F|nr:hypothetical protein [Photobacterium kishitanii]PSW60234.1 hypothetical protein C0W54_16730 [Photobacterium kishitanii]
MKISMLFIVMLFISPSALAHSGHNIVSNPHSYSLAAEVQHYSFLSHTNLLILSILLMILVGYSVCAYVKK